MPGGDGRTWETVRARGAGLWRARLKAEDEVRGGQNQTPEQEACPGPGAQHGEPLNAARRSQPGRRAHSRAAALGTGASADAGRMLTLLAGGREWREAPGDRWGWGTLKDPSRRELGRGLGPPPQTPPAP